MEDLLLRPRRFSAAPEHLGIQCQPHAVSQDLPLAFPLGSIFDAQPQRRCPWTATTGGRKQREPTSADVGCLIRPPVFANGPSLLGRGGLILILTVPTSLERVVSALEASSTPPGFPGPELRTVLDLRGPCQEIVCRPA
jgi:hypothetical protein